MIGQGLLANPALVRQARGGPGPDKETLRAFHDELYHTYLERFASQRNTVFHMKELWSYLSRLFVGGGRKTPQAHPQGGRLPPPMRRRWTRCSSSPCGRRRSGGRALPSEPGL